MVSPTCKSLADRPHRWTGLQFARLPKCRSPEKRKSNGELRKRSTVGDGQCLAATPAIVEAKPTSDENPSKKERVARRRGGPQCPNLNPSTSTAKSSTMPLASRSHYLTYKGVMSIRRSATKINWGYYLRPNAGGVEGRFDANIDWGAGWRARIIASGYVPQPILTEPPKAGQTKIEGLVLRMKRGREVSGPRRGSRGQAGQKRRPVCRRKPADGYHRRSGADEQLAWPR